MALLDIIILVVVVVSILIGLFRGFFREVLSLISWVFAFWVAFTFAQAGSVYLVKYLDNPSLRVMVAFVSLFIITLLIATVISIIAHKIFAAAGLTGVDRTLGGLFGIIRAAALIALLVLFARFADMTDEMWWKESLFIGHFVPLAEMIRDLLPNDLAARLAPVVKVDPLPASS